MPFFVKLLDNWKIGFLLVHIHCVSSFSFKKLKKKKKKKKIIWQVTLWAIRNSENPKTFGTN